MIDLLVPGFLNKIDYLVFVQAAHDHTVHLAVANIYLLQFYETEP